MGANGKDPIGRYSNLSCLLCGRSLYEARKEVLLSGGKKHNSRKYCSAKCVHEKRSKPRGIRSGTQYDVSCLVCGTNISTARHEQRMRGIEPRNSRKYCSAECGNIARREALRQRWAGGFRIRRYGERTKPEQAIGNIVEPLGFRYEAKYITVNGIRMIPDYVRVSDKLIIEVNGEYWHQDREKDDTRKRLLSSVGWKVLMIRMGRTRNWDLVDVKLRIHRWLDRSVETNALKVGN